MAKRREPDAPPPLAPIAAELLAEILAHPDRDAPRLVYADWLSERDDPRGEFIAVQCRLAKRFTTELYERSNALLVQHRARWVAPWLGGRREPMQWTFERGFVRNVMLTPGHFLACAPSLFEREPVQRVEFSQGDLDRLVHCESLAHVRELELWRKSDIQALFANRYLTRLEYLDLENCELGITGCRALAGADPTRFPALQYLQIAAAALEDSSLAALSAATLLDQITAIDLRSNPFSAHALANFIATGRLANVRHLLVNRELDVTSMQTFVDHLGTGPLEQLTLGRLDSAAVGVFARGGFPSLRELRVLCSAAAIGGLGRAHFARNLVTLDLENSPLFTAGLGDVVKRFGPTIEHLVLENCGLSETSIAVLARAELPRLRSLSLARNVFDSAALDSLVDASWLANINRLGLGDREPSAKLVARLAECGVSTGFR